MFVIFSYLLFLDCVDALTKRPEDKVPQLSNVSGATNLSMKDMLSPKLFYRFRALISNSMQPVFQFSALVGEPLVEMNRAAAHQMIEVNRAVAHQMIEVNRATAHQVIEANRIAAEPLILMSENLRTAVRTMQPTIVQLVRTTRSLASVIPSVRADSTLTVSIPFPVIKATGITFTPAKFDLFNRRGRYFTPPRVSIRPPVFGIKTVRVKLPIPRIYF